MSQAFNTTSQLPLGFGTTVGTTSGPVLPANTSNNGLMFVNNSASATIAICPAQVNLGLLGVYTGFAVGIAVINGPGSVTMAPGDKFIIDNLPATGAWNGISSLAGGALTILVF